MATEYAYIDLMQNGEHIGVKKMNPEIGSYNHNKGLETCVVMEVKDVDVHFLLDHENQQAHGNNSNNNQTQLRLRKQSATKFKNTRR